ncbi:aspartate aminotransferase family protein [Marinococcus halophilus]|uniref:Aspartate aminotransferase family protein n=1 Tax=Marinococcus halophilus TaxID=1371 RepID=A0A510YC28_MARHA|nr:aspartate aminotransferase family protein [Marinococcus halophilus]OZT79089.1 aspartate aminotransferase family protein [Marinococcus halophilus]GEK59927.1 aspartate aminotransferase family protein [Marinococcus halophilus]
MNRKISEKQLIDWDKKHYFHPTSSIHQQQDAGAKHIFKSGKGIVLKNHKNEAYIDGMSSLWNVNVGHGRKALGKAAEKQIQQLAFSSSFSTFSNEPAIRLTRKLAQLAPGDLNTTFLTSGGSEAVDTAIKLARNYWLIKGKPAKTKIISRTKSYHGVAIGATNATGLKPFRDFASAVSPDFYFADHLSIDSLKKTIQQEGAEQIAAFIAEPVQGAGGVHPASKEYFQEVRNLCNKHDILFIADEIITGFGRTGKWFGIEHYEVCPDMMCFAKGVTSGYLPLGGVMMTEALHHDFINLSSGTVLHGYTYSGHPTASAVALENIKILEQEDLINNAQKREADFEQLLNRLKEKHPMIKEVRGKGMMWAIEFSDRTTSSKTEVTAPNVVEQLLSKGLICRSVIFDELDCIVLAPPLILSKKQLKRIIKIIDSTLKNYN